MIAYSCPKCRAFLTAHDPDAGKKFPCPSCGQRLQIPSPPPPNKTVLGKLEDLDTPPQTVLGKLEDLDTPPQTVLGRLEDLDNPVRPESMSHAMDNHARTLFYVLGAIVFTILIGCAGLVGICVVGGIYRSGQDALERQQRDQAEREAIREANRQSMMKTGFKTLKGWDTAKDEPAYEYHVMKSDGRIVPWSKAEWEKANKWPKDAK